MVRAQLQQDKLDAALVTAKADIAALPASAESYAAAGDVLIRFGHVPEASLAFSKSLSLDQCSPRAHLGWGRVNGILSRHRTEAHELAAAHALAPNDAEVTMAWFIAEPTTARANTVQAMLATKPNLPPDAVNRLTTRLALLDAGATCTPRSPLTTARFELLQIPFRGRGIRSWALKVVTSAGPLGLVELDSSVSGIVLNPADAAKAGGHRVGPAPLVPSSPYTAIAEMLQIGGVTYSNCPVRVASSAALAGANSLIGLDFFRDSLIHLDYVAQVLSLSPLPAQPADGTAPPEEADWTQMYVMGGAMFMPTLINKKGPLPFLIDTGSYSTVMSPPIVQNILIQSKDATLNRFGSSAELVRVLPREGGGITDVADVHGADGQRIPVSTPFKLPVLRFAKSEFPDDSVISFDIAPLSHAIGMEAAGLVGFRMMSQFTFDFNYRDGLANIVFDQNRRYASRLRDLTGDPYGYVR